MKKKKYNYQQLGSILLLVLTLVIVLYLGFRGNDMNDLIRALKGLSPLYVLACVGCWCNYLLFNTLSLHHFLHIQGYRIKFRHSLHTTINGIYYSNITPGASGGQPMEIYRLSKYGIPIGISGSGLVVKFVVFQGMLLVVGAVLWALHPAFVAEHAAGKYWFVLLGYLANFVSISSLIVMAISQRAMLGIIRWCIRVGVKLRLCKDPEAASEKWENHCRSFLESFELIARRPWDLLVQCAIAVCQLLSLMLVILAVYHALGLSDAGSWEIITMGVLLYIGASYVPLPGASGAQEGGFASLFRTIFPDATHFVALLIWRFCTYYLSVLAGMAVTVWENVSGFHRRKKQKRDDSSETSTEG